MLHKHNNANTVTKDKQFPIATCEMVIVTVEHVQEFINLWRRDLFFLSILRC